MFDDMFSIFVYKRRVGKLKEVISQRVYRVIGEKGMEEFLDEIFNYVCEGYVVEIERYK